MKILNTDMYLLLIDEESEIKKGDYILEKGLIINIFPDYLTNLDECSKIIAYRKLNKEAKELDLPLLPPFEEDNIEKLADNYAVDTQKVHPADSFIAKQSYIEGYKAAQSKQFSLEDVINYSNWLSQWLSYNKYKKVIDGAKPYGIGELISNKDLIKMFVAGLPPSNPPLNQETIQSLSIQQLPSEFIPEYIGGGEYLAGEIGGNEIWTEYPKELKTITNSEGKEELVGVWKFAK